MWTGPALDGFRWAFQSPPDAKNVYSLTSRIRFSF